MESLDAKDDTALGPPELGTRLIALSNLAIGLGHAIQGLGASNQIIEAKGLVELLRFLTNRLTWLERTTDPNWKPYESRDAGNVAGNAYRRSKAARETAGAAGGDGGGSK